MKLIPCAFLCSDVKPRNDAGWDIININTRFELSATASLFVVFLVEEDFARGGIYKAEPDVSTSTGQPLFHSSFRLGLVIQSNANEEIEVQSLDLPVGHEYLAIPIGESLIEPGNYTVYMYADGALQHALPLLLR